MFRDRQLAMLMASLRSLTSTAMLAIIDSCAAKENNKPVWKVILIETQHRTFSRFGGHCLVPDRSRGRGLFV